MHRFSIRTIDLIVEKEIGGQAPRWIRIDPPELVADDEGGRCRLAVVIGHLERHFHRRQALEQNRYRVAEADILRPLADVEAQFGFALPNFPAVQLEDAIFETEPRQLFFERL